MLHKVQMDMILERLNMSQKNQQVKQCKPYEKI